MNRSIHAVQNQPAEWAYRTGKQYADPFHEVELDLVFGGPDGGECRVPAYWAGEGEWRVRFAPPSAGSYRFHTECTDAANAELHGLEGELEAAAYDGDNPLLKHAPIRVAADRRHFEHADGTAFFWLGDTWWMGLCRRWSWPDDFQYMAADRAAKGFSVIQIVAGLYPDMPPFDERGANEAGLPWEADYARIRPAYFDMADLRIAWLVRSRLVPCIVGCWAYFLPFLGVDKMKKHWRNLVARWGAWPVFWCLAGEAAMPYYLSETKEQDAKQQKAGWAEVGRYVRQIDGHHRPVTIHPSSVGRSEIADETALDFNMLQTGHGGHDSIPNTIRLVRQEHVRQPVMPVLVGEVSYEGILHGTGEEIQRLAFWGSLLSGAAGHSYGANGIWQVNRPDQPFGESPWGGNWGKTPWQEAAALPGSKQLGIGAKLLRRYEWWRFEPHEDWVSPAAGENDYFGAYAAGIPGRVRVIYFYQPSWPWAKPLKVTRIEPDASYKAFFFDPRTGDEHPLGTVRGGGDWPVPLQPELKDWVLVLEATRASGRPRRSRATRSPSA